MTARPRCVLVVEDDPPVLKLMLQALRRGGFLPLAATSAAEAKEISRNHAGQIDLALLDIYLAEMNAFQLYEWLQRDRKDLTVLYTSGFCPEDLADAAFLQKPFKPVAMIASIERLLGPPPTPPLVAAA